MLAASLKTRAAAVNPLSIYSATPAPETEPVSAEEAFAIEDRMMAWDLSLLREYLVSKGIFAAADVAAVEQEYKRFMVLNFIDDAVPVSTRVDDYWHGHLLFSEDYAAMCEHVGGRFIHHRPYVLLVALGIKKPMPPAVQAGKHRGLKVVQDVGMGAEFDPYRNRWGEPDPKWWSLAAACCKDGRCGCRIK